MPRTTSRKHRLAVGKQLAALVQQALERGEDPPWRRPWVGGLGRNCSGHTGRPYQNWNAFSTWVTALAAGYRSVRWFTRAAGEKQGWTLRDEARAAGILLPMFGEGEHGDRTDWGGTFVYNRDEFVGAEAENPPVEWDPNLGLGRVAALLRGAEMDLRHDGSAYFHPWDDYVAMPDPRVFDSDAAWAATAVHELVHWTGHPRRLNRRGIDRDGDEYAFEELVAELGASMLCAQLGVPASRVDDDNHRAYLVSWARRIQHHPEALVDALELADQAAGFLLDLVPGALKVDEPLTQDNAPVRLRDGGFWRKDPREDLPPGGPPTWELPDTVNAAMQGFEAALEEGPDPVLLIGGLPGDGVETVLELVRAWLTDERPSPLLLEPPHRTWQGVTATAKDTNLPAFRPGPGPALEGLPSAASEIAWWLEHNPDAPLVAALRVGQPRDLPDHVQFADLGRTPLAAELARRHLAKTEPRRWLALRRRRPANTALFEDWGRRLNRSRPWLDGNRHTPGRAARLRLDATAPFAPVTLQVLQACLDGFCRETGGTLPLNALVRPALARWSGPMWGLIALDHVLGPLADRDHDPGTASLRKRARIVVNVLQRLCPELSRGTKAIAVLLADSVDVDMDAFCAEIDAACRRKPKRRGRGKGQLVKSRGSWSVIP